MTHPRQVSCSLICLIVPWVLFLVPMFWSTLSWSLVSSPPVILSPRFFWVLWTPVLSQVWKWAREYLGPWGWNTLSQHKSVGRNSKHKSHIQSTKTAIYKAFFPTAGCSLSLEPKGPLLPVRKDYSIHSSVSESYQVPIPLSSENRGQNKGRLDVVTSSWMGQGSWACWWHRWPP